MEEGDVESLCAFSGGLVDESHAFGFHLGQCILHTVLNCESEMMDAFASLLDEACDSSVR